MKIENKLTATQILFQIFSHVVLFMTAIMINSCIGNNKKAILFNDPIIIAGSGAVGVKAIQELIKHNYVGKVIWILGQTEDPYDITQLVKILKGISIRQITNFDLSTLKDNYRVIKADKIKKICMDNTLVLESGKIIKFSKLLLGTGNCYTKPPELSKVSNKEGVFSFYSLKEALALHEHIQRNNVRSVAVVGMGFNGIEVATQLKKLGLTVHAIDRNSALLRRLTTPAGSAFLANILHQNGITLHLGKKVAKILYKNHRVSGIELADGTPINVEAIICASGVQSENNFILNSNIACNEKGTVYVDETMQTNIKNIYAAGDLCYVHNRTIKKLEQSHKWIDAQKQAKVAVSNLLGHKSIYAGSPGIRTLKISDTYFVACGSLAHSESTTILEKKDKKYYHAFWIENKKLKGFSLIEKRFNRASMMLNVRRLIKYIEEDKHIQDSHLEMRNLARSMFNHIIDI